jgi:uncharacterized membrane protein YoaK (UPF0700 family)
MNFDLESALGDKPQETLPVAMLLILAAGMLDAYTYVGYGGVFANAMTGNLVVMTVRLSGGDISTAVPYLAPLAAYVCGVAVAHCLKEKPLSAWFPYPARISLGLEVAFLVAVALFGKGVANMAVVTGIAFVAALQATAFTKVEKFAFTSVTTSANLRRFAESFVASVIFRDGKKAAREWKFFLTIYLCFLAGAVASAFATRAFGHPAVWLPIAILSAALVLCMPWNVTVHRLLRDN